MKKKYHPQTESIVRGYDPMLSEGSVVPPVFKTSTFVFKNAEEGKRAFEITWGMNAPQGKHEQPALIYSRVNNPNLNFAEDRLIAWDDAESSALFSSGMGAIACSCFAFLRPGDDLLYADPIYGGSEHLFRKILPEWGIRCHTFPAGADEETILKAARECRNLKVIFLETCANPTMTLTDVRAARTVADQFSNSENSVMVMVDNTFLGPLFCKPIEFGADLVIYSVTKFIGGHSDLIAGSVSGPKDKVNAVKAIRTVFGAMADPETAWLVTRSLSTLAIRMETQQTAAKKIAAHLKGHSKVKRIYYPGDESMGKDQLKLYKALCSGPGSVLSFEVKGGEEEAFRFLNHLKIVKLAVSLGGVESLAQHPYTMTHAEMPIDLKEQTGITDSMIRLSVGLEHLDDLIDDLDSALAKV